MQNGRKHVEVDGRQSYSKTLHFNSMLPTPSTSHVNYEHIYEPAEDSYLLLDTLSSESEIRFLRGRFLQATALPPILLEVGTGSGVVLAFAIANAQRIFGRSDVAALGTDVNPFACVATKQTVELAAISSAENDPQPAKLLDCFLCDLTSAIRPGSIDVLIFNPPYVPSESVPRPWNGNEDGATSVAEGLFQRDSHLLSLSTDGGAEGMETTSRLFDQLGTVLSERGVAYILFCAQNKPDEIIARVRAWSSASQDVLQINWSAEKVASSGKGAGWEKLCIVRIWRNNSQP